jgi:hypothetical protein
MTVCVIDSWVNELTIRFPQITSLVKAINYSAPLYDEFISQGCGVLFFSLQEASKRPKAILQPLCRLNLLPVKEETSVLVSFPVNEDLFASMSLWMQHTYAETGDEYYRNYESHYGTTRCEADGRDITSLGVEMNDHMDIGHFLLPLFVWVGAALAGGFVTFCSRPKSSCSLACGQTRSNPDFEHRSLPRQISEGSELSLPVLTGTNSPQRHNFAATGLRQIRRRWPWQWWRLGGARTASSPSMPMPPI